MTKSSVALPVVPASGNQRLNPNCKVVSGLGEPVYASCRYCDLTIGNCLQFQGQVLSGVIFTVLLVLLAVPMTLVARAAVGLGGAVALAVLLRRVAAESQRSIVSTFQVNETAARLQRRALIHETASGLYSHSAERVGGRVTELVTRSMPTARVLLLEIANEGCVVRADGSGLDAASVDRLSGAMRAWRDQPDSNLQQGPAWADTMGPEDLVGPDGESLSDVLAGAWIAPLRGSASQCLGSLIIWGPSNNPAENRRALDGAEIIASQVALMMENETLSEQLVDRERLSAVGEVALSVAHEINNPLAYIAGSRELLAGTLERLKGMNPSDNPEEWQELEVRVRNLLASMGDSAERIRKTVTDMNAFASTGTDTERPVDLSTLVASAVQRFHVGRAHIDSVRVQVVDDSAPRVVLDGHRAGQVLDNLLQNAAHAVSHLPEHDRHVQVRVGRRGDGWAEVSVSDAGGGVPPEILDRMFQPFVTTKAAGQGSGLGLAVVKRVVEKAGGSVTYGRGALGGAMFTVALPPADRVAAADSPVEPSRPSRGQTQAAAPHQRPKVLLVEDEIGLRDLLVLMVHEIADVVTAEHGAQALEIIEEAEEPFDLILCDLMMPVMGGAEFIDRCGEQYPELVSRIVVMTGGATDSGTLSLLRERHTSGLPVLQKPFKGRQLKELIGSVRSQSQQG